MLESDIKQQKNSKETSQIEWDLTEILLFCVYKVNFALYKPAILTISYFEGMNILFVSKGIPGKNLDKDYLFISIYQGNPRGDERCALSY